MSTISIPTVQNVKIEYPLASVGERIVAYFLDLLFLIGIVLVLLVLQRYLTPLTYLFGEVFIYIFVLFMGVYHFIFEALLNGQSPGKKVMRLKVVNLVGTSPSLSSFFMRWIFRVLEISMFSGSLAAIVIAVNGKGQRLGDLAAGTTVISLKSAASRKVLSLPKNESRPMEYQEVVNLSDAQMAKIRNIYQSARNGRNRTLMDKLAAKIEEKIEVENREYSSEAFVRKIMEDYTKYFED